MRSRLLSMGIGMLALIAALVCVPSTAFAAPPATQAVAAKQHDLSHPVKENYPCAGMSHSGVSRIGETPQFNCSTSNTGGGVHPNAGSQSGNCTGGVTYRQGFTNVPGYNPSTTVYRFYAASPYSYNGGLWYMSDGYLTANTQAWVEYYWCPSNHFASGSINYSKIYVAPTNSNCIDVATGGFGGDGSADNGADLERSDGLWYSGDGESSKIWTGICYGNYIWDYSSLADGQNQYTAIFTSTVNVSGFSGAANVRTPRAQ